mmetsp:Transcript_4997/g.9436  ORF Transcript_4997/g.9436 Transcript_4997/m.9436 type:complete len:305 (-) Transcript_4997:264-1178(-)
MQPVSKRKGQKTTLVIHDPCPGYIPPAHRERDESRVRTEQQQHQLQHYVVRSDNDNDSDDAGMELDWEDEYRHSTQQTQQVLDSHQEYHHGQHLPSGEEQHYQDISQLERLQTQQNDLPTVVLDCANIGWAFGMDSFSPAGLSIAYHYFQDFHVNVLGFLPSSYYTRRPNDGSRDNPMKQTVGWDIIDSLIRSDQMVIVPSGDSDDLYILQYARMNGAFVVSNDFFTDHVRSLSGEDATAQATAWLKQYRCSYTFIKNGPNGGTFMPSPASSMMDVLEGYRKGSVAGGHRSVGEDDDGEDMMDI